MISALLTAMVAVLVVVAAMLVAVLVLLCRLLAAGVARATCVDLSDGQQGLACSACGKISHGVYGARFCPRCGARVVEG